MSLLSFYSELHAAWAFAVDHQEGETPEGSDLDTRHDLIEPEGSEVVGLYEVVAVFETG